MGKSNKGADGKDGKDEKVPVPVQSRQFSCSELKEGHKVLLAVKSENLSEEALQKQIQDLFFGGENGHHESGNMAKSYTLFGW